MHIHHAYIGLGIASVSYFYRDFNTFILGMSIFFHDVAVHLTKSRARLNKVLLGDFHLRSIKRKAKIADS